MDCNRFNDLISLYIDNELSKEEEKIFLNHLDNCNNCKEKYEQMKMISDYLKDSEEVELPPGYNLKLREKLSKEKSYNNKNKYRWKYISTIAATFLILITSVSLVPKLLGNMGKSMNDNMKMAEDNYITEFNAGTAKNEAMDENKMEDKKNIEKTRYGTADIVFTSEENDLNESIEEIKNYVLNNNGYVNSEYSFADNQMTKEIIITVPVDKLNNLIEFIENKLTIADRDDNNYRDSDTEYVKLRIIVKEK